LIVLNSDLVEATKASLKGQTIGKFVDLPKDMENPYVNGIRFRFSETLCVPLNLKHKKTMRVLDVVGILMCLDYAPQGQKVARFVDRSEVNTQETRDLISQMSLKHAVYKTFGGKGSCLWKLEENSLDGFIRPDVVARSLSSKTNGIYLYAALLQKVESNPAILEPSIKQKMSEVGLLQVSLVKKDFGSIPQKKKGTTKKKTLEAPEKPAQPVVTEPTRKRPLNPFKLPERRVLKTEPEPTLHQDPDVLGMPDQEPPKKKRKSRKKPQISTPFAPPVSAWDTVLDAFFDD
jgi:hypothetical protein